MGILTAYLAGLLPRRVFRSFDRPGGGVVIIPLLTLGFGVDIRYAIGASLVSVIATSSASAAACVKKGFANLRVGMFLEIATTIGAIAGASLAAKISTTSMPSFLGWCLYILHINPFSPAGKAQAQRS